MAGDFSEIQKHPYVNFGTFRKNGTHIATPVWFVVEGGNAYIWSQRETWKVKRLLNNSACDLTPCNVTGKKNIGPTLAGVGKLIEPGRVPAIKKLFRKKYGLPYTAGEFFGRLRPGSDHVYIEIASRAA